MPAMVHQVLHHFPRLPALQRRWLLGAASVVALMLLTAAVAWWMAARRPAAIVAVASSAPLTLQQQRTQAHCVEGALLFNDVRWAAVCMKLASQGEGDGHADCELPDAESAKLYALLQREERRCLALARETP